MPRETRPIELRKLMPFSDSARKYRTSDSIHSEDEEPLMDEEALLGATAVLVLFQTKPT
jgi:phospholipid-translocating ATPase